MGQSHNNMSHNNLNTTCAPTMAPNHGSIIPPIPRFGHDVLEKCLFRPSCQGPSCPGRICTQPSRAERVVYDRVSKGVIFEFSSIEL